MLTPLERRRVASLTAFHAAPDGRLFAAASDGSVSALSLEGTSLRETGLATVRGAGLAIDGGPRGRGYELFVLSSVGDVDRVVLDDPPERLGTIQGVAPYVTIVRTGEGEALALTESGAHHADVDGLTAEALPDGGGTLFAAAMTPVGAILGYDTGRMFRRIGAAYEELVSPQIGFWVVGVAPFRTGFVFLLASGAVGLYLPETGFCPLTPVFRAIQGGAVVVAGERVVAIGVLASLAAVGQTLEFQ